MCRHLLDIPCISTLLLSAIRPITTVFRCVSDGASKGVLNVLKSIHLSLRKVKAQRVTIVEFEMYNRSGDGVGCFEMKVGANASQLTNVIVARPLSLIHI